jgi:hypothetical protein
MNNTPNKRMMVICRLPKSGLGNQLFPLMKAFVFAYLNGLTVVVTGYHQFKIGPYLRREKSKRSYRNYFTFQKSIAGELLDRWKVRKKVSSSVVTNEPDLAVTEGQVQDAVYSFHAVPHWNDYFGGLKEHRRLVIGLLWRILNKNILHQVDSLEAPTIGVHIRRGDFRTLAANQDFAKVGAVRTPEKYFVDTIEAIRKLNGKDLPVSVFTDGYKHEFETLFALKNIRLIEGNLDVVDMLLLSKSKIIITSAGSTFSYWAGFLSDAPVILHPDHIHEPIRMPLSEDLYEGPFDAANILLASQIKKISMP